MVPEGAVKEMKEQKMIICYVFNTIINGINNSDDEHDSNENDSTNRCFTSTIYGQ